MQKGELNPDQKKLIDKYDKYNNDYNYKNKYTYDYRNINYPCSNINKYKYNSFNNDYSLKPDYQINKGKTYFEKNNLCPHEYAIDIPSCFPKQRCCTYYIESPPKDKKNYYDNT